MADDASAGRVAARMAGDGAGLAPGPIDKEKGRVPAMEDPPRLARSPPANARATRGEAVHEPLPGRLCTEAISGELSVFNLLDLHAEPGSRGSDQAIDSAWPRGCGIPTAPEHGLDQLDGHSAAVRRAQQVDDDPRLRADIVVHRTAEINGAVTDFATGTSRTRQWAS